MPYIDKEKRKFLDEIIVRLSANIRDAGELNYAITRLAVRFLLFQGGLKYDNINTVAGVLQKVLAEFDARVTRPYEKEKIIQNGDVSEYTMVDELISRMHQDILMAGIQKACSTACTCKEGTLNWQTCPQHKPVVNT